MPYWRKDRLVVTGCSAETIAIMRLLEPVVHVEMMSKEHSVARVDDDTFDGQRIGAGFEIRRRHSTARGCCE